MTGPLYIDGDGGGEDKTSPLVIPADTPVGNLKATTPTKKMPAFKPGRQYHRLGLQSYAYQNSDYGVYFCIHNNYDSMDIDATLSLDNVIMACHDDKPCKKYPGSPHRGGFIGPENYQISTHNYTDTTALRTKNGIRIAPAKTRILRLAAAGKATQLEPKTNDRRWTNADLWGEFYRWCVDHDALVMIKMLDNIPIHDDVLKVCRKIGFQTRTIVSANL